MSEYSLCIANAHSLISHIALTTLVPRMGVDSTAHFESTNSNADITRVPKEKKHLTLYDLNENEVCCSLSVPSTWIASQGSSRPKSSAISPKTVVASSQRLA